MRSMVEGAVTERRERMRSFQPTFRKARKLRRDMTLPEVLLWDCLRGNRLEGIRFRRQHPVGPYVLDFYCAAVRLAVEVDGLHHDHPGQMAHDKRRDGWLTRQGIQVMRIAATDILNEQSFEGVWMMILEAAIAPLPPPPTAVPLPRFAGEEPALQPSATLDPPPFTGEGDHAKHGGGGANGSPIFKAEERDQP